MTRLRLLGAALVVLVLVVVLLFLAGVDVARHERKEK